MPLPMKSSLTAIPSPGLRLRMVVMVLVAEKSTAEVCCPVMSRAEEDWPNTTGSPPVPRSTKMETFRQDN